MAARRTKAEATLPAELPSNKLPAQCAGYTARRHLPLFSTQQLLSVLTPRPYT